MVTSEDEDSVYNYLSIRLITGGRNDGGGGGGAARAARWGHVRERGKARAVHGHAARAQFGVRTRTRNP